VHKKVSIPDATSAGVSMKEFAMILKRPGVRLMLAVLLPIAAVGGTALPGLGKPKPRIQPPVDLGIPPPLVPLNTVPVPTPDLTGIVRDKAAAIRLGKALFWDMQLGSNGMACASCHYQAGADGRDRNQLAHAFDGVFDTGHTVNQQLTLTDFPFTQFVSILDNASAKTRDSNDVVGSQGVIKFAFTGLNIDVFGRVNANDLGTPISDLLFRSGTVSTRQVTGRNSPSVINAVFNQRNFWDGRAHNEFNGVNPFGDSDVNARVYRNNLGVLESVRLSIKDASLASQAVGPVNNDVEMAFGGRNFADVGRKVIGVKPLAQQKVALDDSVLGTMASTTKGLNATYRAMIEAAFEPEWWNSRARFKVVAGRVVPDATGTYDQMQANFSLFFGLAVQAYEATLVSDDTPYDRYLAGNTAAMSPAAVNGMAHFQTLQCNVCHAGGPLTSASSNIINLDLVLLGVGVAAEVMPMADGLPSAYDIGYYNIGVRPTAEDLGVGGTDPFGNPLSLVRSLQLGLIQDPFRPAFQTILPTTRAGVDGAFKTPGLRNVALTAPYFHNGSAATLGQVIEFYQRAGNFSRQNIVNLSPEVFPTFIMTPAQKNELLQFLLALTDSRVEKRAAPFDHPELVIPNGHAVTRTGTISTSGGLALSNTLLIPATGRNGGVPLRRFLGNVETSYP